MIITASTYVAKSKHTAQESEQQARAALRRAAQAQAHRVTGHDTITRHDGGQPVKVDGLGEWEYSSEDDATGHIVQWSVDATPADSDMDHPLVVVTKPDDSPDDEVLAGDVPADETAYGGGIRVQHDLPGEVTCYAYGADGQRVGYRFAVELVPGVLHVELAPGAVRITVQPDVDPDPDEDTDESE